MPHPCHQRRSRRHLDTLKSNAVASAIIVNTAASRGTFPGLELRSTLASGGTAYGYSYLSRDRFGVLNVSATLLWRRDDLADTVTVTGSINVHPSRVRGIRLGELRLDLLRNGHRQP
jgi:hypothetical protein